MGGDKPANELRVCARTEEGGPDAAAFFTPSRERGGERGRGAAGAASLVEERERESTQQRLPFHFIAHASLTSPALGAPWPGHGVVEPTRMGMERRRLGPPVL